MEAPRAVTSTGPEARPANPPDAEAAAGMSQLVLIITPAGDIDFHRALSEQPDAPDFTGSSVYELIHPPERGQLRDALDFVFERQKGTALDLCRLGPHKPGYKVRCRISPNLRDGTVISVMLVGADIPTPQPAPPQEAPVSEDPLTWLRTVSDAAGEALFVSDAATGQILDANETACRWMSLQHADLLTRSVKDFRGEPPLEFRRAPAQPFTETRTLPRPATVEGMCRRRDGTTFAVESTLLSLRLGERDCVVAMVRDAKRPAHQAMVLRDLEARYHGLFDDTRDAVFLITRNGQIAEANAAALRMFDTNVEDIATIDMRRRIIFRPDNMRRFQEEIVRNGKVTDIPVTVRRPDGASSSGLFSATSMRTPAGGVRGYQCVVRTGPPSSSEPVILAQRPEAPPAEAPRPKTGENKVLLVIEDPAAREEAVRTLLRAGVRGATAINASRAAAILQESPTTVGLMVLEITPHSATLDLLRAAARAAPATPILVICDEREVDLGPYLTSGQRIEVLPHPAHPLALVQRVKSLTASPPAGRGR